MTVSLQKTSEGWTFASEAALEHLLWENLEPLLHLTPLQRQYVCNGEVCDILALTQQRSLVILELKNVEDRYVIQQLTRYYANLLEEKPFQSEIDYSLPVRLLAIAPSYHRHNWIDRQHSTLPFELWRFAVQGEPGALSLHLTSLDTQESRSVAIAYTPPMVEASGDIPEPPATLLKWLGGCTAAEQDGILKLRQKLLSHPRIKEIVEKNKIQYGSGKTRVCAELIFQPSKQRPVLFLWLPTPSSRFFGKSQTGRLRVWIDGTGISHVGHVAEGLGKMRTKTEWMQLPPEKRPKGLTEGLSYKSHTPVAIKTYFKGSPFNSEATNPEESVEQDTWEVLAQMVLAAWS